MYGLSSVLHDRGSASRRLRSTGLVDVIRFVKAALLFTLLTVVMTWPQAARLTTGRLFHARRFTLAVRTLV